jgi:hypothetical protein
MKSLHAVWCFLALAFACALSCHSVGFALITGLSLFFWSALVYYWRGNKQVG